MPRPKLRRSKPHAHHLVALFALATLLSACGAGGSGGPGGSSLTTLSAAVEGYTLNTGATLRAPSDNNPNLDLGNGSLSLTPDPRLTLNLATADSLLASMLAPFENPCPTGSSSNPTARGTGFGQIEVYQGTRLIGVLAHGNGHLDFEDPRLDLSVNTYLYSDRPVRLSGSCIEQGIRASYDMTLQRGWNVIRTEIVFDEALEPPLQVIVRNQTVAPLMPWLFLDLRTFSASSEPEGGASIREALRLAQRLLR
jgi:hypothetical protein